MKPAVNTLAPVIGMTVQAKTKNKQNGASTANTLKSLTGGKILSLTDMHGHCLSLKVM